MSKFTFISEQFDYDEYTGEQRNLISKTTREFHGHTLEGLLDEMTAFLRGAGYHFDGHLDVVSYESEINKIDDELDELKDEMRSQRVFDHIVRDIQNNPFEKNKDKDSFGDIFISSEDISSGTEDDIFQLDLNFDEDKCSLCKLPKSVMQLHQCFDPSCPSGAYRNQYAN